MPGERVPGPLGVESAAEAAPLIPPARGSGRRDPIGMDEGEPTQLDTTRRIVKVSKDWSDPPAVRLTQTPELSGATLKQVLTQLERLPEWGTGGGNLSGTGKDGEITLVPSKDGKGYEVEIKGDFFMTLPKWKEYAKATDAQKKAWDAMIDNLRAHEQEHVDIAYRGAEKLVKDLKGLDVQLASQKIADSQTATQNGQDDFDSTSKTDHGKNDFGKFKKVVLDTSADP